MDYRYLKDTSIVLAILMVLSFAVVDYLLYTSIKSIPEESEHKEMKVSAELEKTVKDIGYSMRDRRQFKPTLYKDPLQQNLIVKTQVDLEKQWEEMVKNQLRLSAVMIDADGNRRASFAYGGSFHLTRVGDSIAGYRVSSIGERSVTLASGSGNVVKTIEPIPAKPKEITTDKKNAQEYNW